PDGHALKASGDFVSIEPSQLADLNASQSSTYTQLHYGEQQQLVSQSPVVSLDPAYASIISGLGWRLMVDQDPAQPLPPPSPALRVTLAAGLAALLAAGLLAVILAQALAAPIGHLTLVAGQIARGDLSRRVLVRQRDEIGLLADSFNTMSQSLEERITAERA